MRYIFKPKIIAKITSLLAITVLTGVQIAAVLPVRAAANATFNLTPGSGTVTTGSDLNIALVLNTGGNSVLAWKTTINYSTTAFSSASVTTASGSHFTLNPGTDVASSGVIKIARYAKSGSTTSGTVANITLHSSGVGSSGLSFAHACSPTSDATQCSAITDSGGTNLIANMSGGTYEVAAIPVAGGSTVTKTTVKKKTPAAAISEVAQAITDAIAPSSTKKATNSDRSTVKVTVVDQKGKAVEGAKVTLEGISAQSNKSGEAILTDLLPGNATGFITYKNQKQVINLYVDSGSTLDSPQEARFTIKVPGSGLKPVLLAILGAAIIALIIYLITRPKGGVTETSGSKISKGSFRNRTSGAASHATIIRPDTT